MGKTSKVASIKKGAEKITWRATAELVPYAKNARLHSDAQIREIANSITEFGFTNPVLLCDNGVLAGHGRLLAAEILGMSEVPTIDLGYLSEAQQRAYVIADNQLAINAGWDIDLLRVELQELEAVDFDLGLLGFSADFTEEVKGLNFEPASEDEQGRLDETESRLITCPTCSAVFDLRDKNEY